ncbi:CHAD domain-containing protein [Kineococcus xinjiangensis]|uniref:CHAD domain-containing protein n=1 Tax=Kineococcus xinjiangensis TaxID=512762 RepID=A0A2S6ID03_9ACTN|nr:CYTH and CHAD domain-containing protein [Kineococcus xinjiangensis]PPK92077.1 CHAD domain-containing protein [Kineococcus xinjiangensis]
MPSLHRELEAKYDLDDTAELPDLSSLLDGQVFDGAVAEHRLEATYFDTAEHTLAAHRITLRRRKGGSDAGWHLKLPAADGARQEVRLPLGRVARTVPAALQAMVWSRTLGAPLVPVATITTRRREQKLLDADARVVAEVADDRVEARRVLPLEGAGTATGAAQSWRELEVELVDGEPALLEAVDAALRAAGVQRSASGSKLARVLGPAPAPERRKPLTPKSTAGAVVQAHLAEQVEQITVQDPQVRLDAPDSIHKMRVATRRLRSALRTFRPLLPDELTRPLRDELKWLAAELGAARDAEVMRERLLRAVAAEDPALLLGAAGQGIDAPLSKAYAEAHVQVVATLDGERYRKLLVDLHSLVTEPPFTGRARRKAREILPGRVAKTYATLAKLVERAESAPSKEEREFLLHEARKAAKQTRYAAESVASVFGAEATAFAKAVTKVQEVLGEHQDSVVTRERIRDLAATTDSPAAAFALGRLHAQEEASGERAEQQFAQVWDRSSAKSLRRWLR